MESNKKSFLWGRRAAVDLAAVEKVAMPSKPIVLQMPESLDKLIQRRVALLTDYQNSAYAARYEALVNQVKQAEEKLGKGNKLATAVAKYAYKLMAYKDEYEVARLYTNGEFADKLKAQFEGDFSVKFNLAPPLFSKKDNAGHLVKAQYGSWVWQAFKVLAKFKSIRGTALDLFGYTDERKAERKLAADYQQMIAQLVANLDAQNYDVALKLANLPEQVRGFGHVKEKAMRQYYAQVDQLSLVEDAAKGLAAA